MKTISNFCKNAAMISYAEQIGNDDIRLYANSSEDGTVKVEVSWSSIGAQDAESAVKFAADLNKAALIAAVSPLNGCKIIY